LNYRTLIGLIGGYTFACENLGRDVEGGLVGRSFRGYLILKLINNDNFFNFILLGCIGNLGYKIKSRKVRGIGLLDV